MRTTTPYDDTAATVRAAIARRPDRVTVTALADQIGMPRQRLGSRLSGRTEFRVSELQALADALDVPVSALLDAGPALTHRGGRP